MVYGGKPSTGCKNCRQRKIKCNEQKPACTQCTNTGRVCPGYTNLFDLVLRDETESVARKAQRKKKREANAKGTATTTAAADTLAAGRSTGSNRTVPPSSAIATTATSGLLLPKSFQGTPEQQAINTFFSNYILIPRHPLMKRGYLECLLPLYQNTRHDSLLSLATTAMALAIEGGSPSTQHYRQVSRSYFGKALVKTGRAIRDPVESIKDETLMSVLLLSFYESRLKYPFGKTSADLDSLRPNTFENSASRLTSLSAQVSDLLAFANPTLRNRNEFPSRDQLMAILDYATKVEAQLSTWPDSVPDDWRWRPSHSFDNLPSQERKLYVYNRRVDIYHDIWVASIWNSYRGTMLMIQYTVLQTLGMLRPPPLSHLGARIAICITTVQNLVDDICGSVPFNLGTKTFGGPSDRKELRYPDDGVNKPSSDYRTSAAGLGGWFLMEPLKTASRAICLRQGQQEWILKQIERIQRIYTIKKPIEDPTSSMPSPACPGGRG
ncbi:MAG: hypothetical protein LQ338_005235 [Usnochroma carphineum]|nr:MAG: hypothetical protein LQ338_005235 [Usnochroma carphineum]